ncbi:hypothetical protein Syun_022459 [Stephania yunnanensis]|uniref:Uncharacterized protein n=1 Tax=Stephania yunnanensis TaxID=152371 RepID=A0AAP0FIT6_9MAGN
MKRFIEEISDDEWENHSFKPSRVLKREPSPSGPSPQPPPPAIESFSYRSSKRENSKKIDVDFVEIEDSLEDDDVVDAAEARKSTGNSRSRRFVFDDESDEDFEEVSEVRSKAYLEDTELIEFDEDLGVVEVEEDDVVGKALQKCAKISAELKKEIYGSSTASFDRYAEVEGSSVRIVTQDDIDAACATEESDFQPTLKPYQLVGVNFLLLLYRKNVAGGRKWCENVCAVKLGDKSINVNFAWNGAYCVLGVGNLAAKWKNYTWFEVGDLFWEDVSRVMGLDEVRCYTRPHRQLDEVHGWTVLGDIATILADEMGLGKTVQAITYLTLLKHLNNDPGPHLIVCPASVLENWEREFRRWCPSFSVLQYHGAGRAAYAKELTSLSKAGLPPPFNVLLVCYSMFERHSMQQKDDRKLLKRWRWSCVLMDEAHALKDKNSYRWKNLMSVAQNANQRLMLTGTPLQNDLHELWSLLEFIMPDLFATGGVDLKKLLSAEDGELIARIKSILGPFILRRLKSDVMKQLVPKIQRVEYVFMGKQQEESYKEAIEEYRAASRARLAKFSDLTHTGIDKVLPRRQISNYFVQFRKIANHPLLVRRIYNEVDIVRFAKILYPKGAFGFECTLERVIEEMKSYNDFSIHRLLVSYIGTHAKGALQDDHVLSSAKCNALAELLPSLKKSGHRVLIFSQWTSMLDILEWALDVIGVTYRRLDGSTQVTDRQTIVDMFNNDTSIFACLLSTRAGGQGLNLTGADTVIIHDMDFNPQIDRQAEDRCHRIGQTKPVTIYRLVTKGTVDENVYEIANRKLVLDAAVLESGVEVNNEGNMSEKTMGEILSALLITEDKQL